MTTMSCGNYLFNSNECKLLQIKVLDFNAKIAQVFSKFILRELLIKHNIRHKDNLKQGAEGLVFNIQLFEYLESAYYLSEPLLHYVYNDKSISHSHNEKNYYLIVKCFEYINKFIETSINKKILRENLYNRLLFVIVTTAISGYYNPENKQKLSIKNKKYNDFINQPILVEALKKADFKHISLQRKVILFFIRKKIFFLLPILGYIRKKQLSLK